MNGGEEYKYAMKKQAVPVVFDNIDAIMEAVRTKTVAAALIDVYVAAENAEKLKTLQLQEIIEHVFMNGIVFQNDGFHFVQCIRDFVLSRQMDILELIAKRINIKPLATHLHVPSSSIDHRNPSFYIPTLGLLATLVGVLVIGYLVERILLLIKRSKQLQKDEMIEELSLAQWRNEYKSELSYTVMAIREDMKRIKLKADVINDKLREDYDSGPSSMMLLSEKEKN